MRLFGRALVWLIVLVPLPHSAVAAEALPRSVLIFDQSEPNSTWGVGFRAAVRTMLNADLAQPVAIYSEILDLGRFGGKRYEELLKTYLLEKYSDKPIGVIVVHGSRALEILLRLRGELWPTVPVVFAVVDEATVARLNLPPDVTGTILRSRLSNPVTAARAIVPNLKRIVLIGDPFERQPFRQHYAQELPQLAKELEIIDLLGLPLADILKRVAVLPDDTAIIYTSIYVDGAGATYIPPEPLVQVAETANRPILGDAEPQIGYGATGGSVAVADPIGKATALLALRILYGEKAATIPITAGDFFRPIFDWRRLQRFGISENMLPPGSEVRNRTQSLWEQYRWQLNAIIAGILLQAAIIFALLYERHRRRLAEIESRQHVLQVMHLNRTAAAGVMSASIAHELNQPLGAILANTETAELLLASNSLGQDQLKEILADIRQADQRAGDIINGLRNMLKKSASEQTEFDLDEAIEGTLLILHPEIVKRGVDCIVHRAGLPLPVRANQVQLQQVILNLAMNGMDAMLERAPGTRRLTLETALTRASEVEVSISDAGIGIPSDKLNTIFETFYTTKQEGSGLGLSIARSIIENCGGKIWAENRLPSGATFRFTMPLAVARAG